MLAGNLPFGKDLLHCQRFQEFSRWISSQKPSNLEDIIEELVNNSEPSSPLRNSVSPVRSLQNLLFYISLYKYAPPCLFHIFFNVCVCFFFWE